MHLKTGKDKSTHCKSVKERLLMVWQSKSYECSVSNREYVTIIRVNLSIRGLCETAWHETKQKGNWLTFQHLDGNFSIFRSCRFLRLYGLCVSFVLHVTVYQGGSSLSLQQPACEIILLTWQYKAMRVMRNGRQHLFKSHKGVKWDTIIGWRWNYREGEFSGRLNDTHEFQITNDSYIT